MVTPVNPDKSVNHRLDAARQPGQRMSTGQDRQATDSPQPQAQPATESRLEIETARQLYQLENQRASNAPRITTPEQASVLLGEMLQQFTDNPAQSLQAQSPPSPTALRNLLERSPV
jgi:hypothetical protein